MKTPPITSLFTVCSLTAAATLTTAHADLVAWWSFDSPPSGGVVTDSRAGLPGQLGSALCQRGPGHWAVLLLIQRLQAAAADADLRGVL
jgi:hypothetical protein